MSTSSEVVKVLTVQYTVVSSCCQHVVVCAGCNRTWRMGSERCPLCNTSTPQTFELRGFDAKALQCSICQGVASPPVVSSCCQHVVVCAGCNRTWRMGSERCPLCNTSTPQTFELRGFDEIVGRLNPTDRDVAEDQHIAQVQGDGDSGDEFQDLPTFRVSPSQ